MMECLDIAKLFIVQASQDGLSRDMTNMKVNKLLYYLQCLYLALYEEPLFEDEIQAWVHGPVCPPVYTEYKEFKNQQLPIPSIDDLPEFPKNITDLMGEVWCFLGEHHAYKLSDMTHQEFPWQNARGDLPADAPSQNPLLLNDLKDFGEQMLDDIERSHPEYQKMIEVVLTDALSGKASKDLAVEDIDEWVDAIFA
ncbi:MAG: DUF4065 domain-containing protein [Symploca sp. SIO2E6]|nr:DUF4065 domain-containing protein [Symploca sp. SIO2E6]